MGSIYQGAKIVFAAAYGYDVDAGLPGTEAGPFPLRGPEDESTYIQGYGWSLEPLT